MTPLTDPRPFSEVLRDWLDRHGLTVYAASTHGKHIGPLSAGKDTVTRWLAGAVCPYEREVRALMTMIDEGRRSASAPSALTDYATSARNRDSRPG